MEIRASGQLNLNNVKALSRFAMFKKADPKKRMVMWTVIYGLILAVVIAQMVLLGVNSSLLFIVGVAVFVLLFEYYLYFLAPKIKYNGMGKLKDAVNTYVFADESMQVSTVTADISGESKILYTALARCYETSKHLFLYQTNNQVFLVDKSTLEDGTAEELRAKLIGFLEKKYIVCKY